MPDNRHVRPNVRLALLATVDPVLRGSAAFAALVDVPETVVVIQDLDPGRAAPIHRHVADAGGQLLDEWVEAEHACVGCALREDTIPLVAQLIASGRYRNVLIAPPIGAETLPLARALDRATHAGGPLAGARLASVGTVCDVGTLVHDVLGDDLLRERGLALADDDIRSVGEVLAHQVGHADFVLTADPLAHAPAQASALLAHLRGAGSHLVDDFLARPLHDLFDHSHLCEHASRRIDPLHAAHNGAPERDGVWTMHLTSSRPMHPERFLALLPALAGDRVRSRGHFWVATRPDLACIWDGAGSQLSIGAHGHWGSRQPATSLVFTGVAEERGALVDAFDRVLVTGEEAEQRGQGRWEGQDGLDPWLGPA